MDSTRLSTAPSTPCIPSVIITPSTPIVPAGRHVRQRSVTLPLSNSYPLDTIPSGSVPVPLPSQQPLYASGFLCPPPSRSVHPHRRYRTRPNPMSRLIGPLLFFAVVVLLFISVVERRGQFIESWHATTITTTSTNLQLAHGASVLQRRPWPIQKRTQSLASVAQTQNRPSYLDAFWNKRRVVLDPSSAVTKAD